MLATASLIVLCLAAAWLDVRYRRLPNALNGLLTIVGLAVAFADAGAAGLASHALHFGLALILGGFLFYLGIVGGGDAKFYAATAAWFNVHQAGTLALAIALAGVLVVFGAMARRMMAGGPLLNQKGESFRRGVPYGVAIALGAITVLWLQGGAMTGLPHA